jgi:hypothetical protein
VVIFLRGGDCRPVLFFPDVWAGVFSGCLPRINECNRDFATAKDGTAPKFSEIQFIFSVALRYPLCADQMMRNIKILDSKVWLK